MSRLRCTRKNNCRGFALSFDAALAVVLFVGALAFMQLAPYPEPDAGTALAQTRQLADDAIAALENTGFIAGKFDELGFSQDAVDAIYAEFRSIAPELDANIAIREYDYNLARCLETGMFGDCFPESDMFTVSTGNSAPADSGLTRGSRVFVRKQGPSVCTKELQLSGNYGLAANKGPLFFAENLPKEIFLQEDGNGSDVNFTFDANVVPGNEAECGENIDVTLSASALSEGRSPVNIMLVIDRSGSMDECAISDGNIISTASGQTIGHAQDTNSGTLGGGTRQCLWWFFGFCLSWGNYQGWGQIHSINVTDLNVFSVYMGWTAACGGGCPEMYINSPNDINYGFYGGPPPGGEYTSTSTYNYIETGMQSARNGTWRVYGWNDNPAINYSLTIYFFNWKKAAEFHIGDRNAFDVLVEWQNCISGCPSMYIESPTGKTYGYYGGSPSGGCDVASAGNEYISVPKSASETGMWIVWVGGDAASASYSITVKETAGVISKMDAAENSAQDFVNNPDWNSSPAQDKLGLASYSTSATLNETLKLATSANKAIINNSIEALYADGWTATGDGIQIATNELVSSRATPNSIKFQVLLSDGQTNRGMDSGVAAQNAKDNNVTIYTIGFGPDADESELWAIAQITGGEYYKALDVNRLQAVYELIAQSIGEGAGRGATSAKVYVPIPEGMRVVSPGSGAIEGNYLVFNAGDLNGASPWTGRYTITYPCTDPNCDANTLTIPGEGTYVLYDTNRQIAWDVNVTIMFKYRDLNVMIISGKVLGENDVYLDVRAANIGYLDSGATSVDFYLGDPDSGGELIGSMPVSALCPMNEPGCMNYYVLELRHLLREGELYSVINRGGAISECPGNNKDWILCMGAPKTKYYSLQYTVWRKY